MTSGFQSIAVKQRLVVMCMFCVIAFVAMAQNDSLTHVAVDDIIVVSETVPKRTMGLRLSSIGETHWGIESMLAMPSLTGVADPMAQLQSLPGIQTTNELNGGIYVQGFDNAHNYITVEGVPVYGAQHLLGFFSVFNTLHFSEMSFGYSTSPTRAGRLGAHIGMVTSDSIGRNRSSGQFTLSPLETMATISCPVGTHSALSVSGRLSNVNLLYDRIINRPDEKGTHLGYSFGDLNATWLFQPDSRNRWKAFAYWGQDAFRWKHASTDTKGNLDWGNWLAGAIWHHRCETGSLTSELFTTSLVCHSDLGATNISANIQSLMATWGIRTTYNRWTQTGRLEYGVEYLAHRNIPLTVTLIDADDTSDASAITSFAHEASLFARLERVLSPSALLRIGGRASCFHSTRDYLRFDPQLLFQYDGRNGDRWHCSIGSFSQYLTQVSVSSASLPMNGWFLADKTHRPQHAWKAEVGWERETEGREYFLSANLFFGILRNQWEFEGNVMSAVFDTFRLDEYLRPCDGRAWGTSLMIQKRKGIVTGWLATTLLRSLRYTSQDGSLLTYPATQERPVEVNAVTSCHFSDRLCLTANILWAMGTPYTRVEKAFILQENLFLEMGHINGSRYPATHRFDLGLTYSFPERGRIRQQVAFSIYNATWARNPLMYQYDYSLEDKTLSLKPFCLFTTCVPAIAYSLRF